MMKKNIVFAAFVVLILFGVSRAGAANFFDEVQQVKEYNPDGDKYEFVKTYLKSLTYLKGNADRAQDLDRLSAKFLDENEKIYKLMDELIQENVNLRVARNLLKKFWGPRNGLMLKAVDLFMKACDQYIEANNKERQLLDAVYQKQLGGGIDPLVRERFWSGMQELSAQRREISRQLLESAMLVGKVLVSDKPNRFGELVSLGVTREQRKKLLREINQFEDKEFSGPVREGQSFLQGSVAAIRQVLEDNSWDTLD